MKSYLASSTDSLKVGELEAPQFPPPMKEKENFNLIKIVFPLEQSEWHNHANESMWAQPLGGNRFRIDNIPFFVYGLSNRDVVSAENLDANHTFKNVVERGGHSTYRIFPNKQPEGNRVSEFLLQLKGMGCSLERERDVMIAVDVPPSTNIYDVYHLLENGVDEDIWDFEEGHCGHPVSI